MRDYFIEGFFKGAQEEQQTDVSMPEDNQDKDTTVTCMSDCIYSQNPEKRCTLDSVSLYLDGNAGTFSCGQYAPQMAGPAMGPEQPQ